MTQYSYDDTGVYFAYFVTSALSLILLPLSYWWITDWSQSFTVASACQCSLCNAKFIANRNDDRRAHRASRFTKSALLLLGWAVVAYLGTVIYSTEITLPVQWDPWGILGVTKSANRSQIKRAYHKLAMTQHPDKVKDTSLKEKANAIFSDISKAYKVLSDPDAYKKFEEWGDPDGKQSFSMGIALPTALVAAHNSSLVLLAYGLVFGGLLPWRIGKWWYKTRKYTKDRVLSPTMGVLFKRTHEDTGLKSMMANLAHAAEFGDGDNIPYRGESDDKLIEELEKKVTGAFSEVQETSWDPNVDLKDVKGRSPRKALLQLIAHMLRPKGYVPNSDAQRTVTKMAHILQCGLLPITLARGWLIPSLYCMDLTQLLSQGMWHTRSPIFQVPHITPAHVKAMLARDPPIRSLQDFAEMADGDRRGLFREIKGEQYKDISAFLSAYPRIVLEKLDFKVIGEPSITPNALVTCILRVRLAPISITRDQLSEEYEAKKAERAAAREEAIKLGKAPLESENEDDEDMDALELEGEGDGGRGAKAAAKLGQSIKFSHAPWFPANKRPGWWVFIGNLGGNRVINAKRISDLQDRRTIKIQFQAPGDPGVYPFSVFIKSDHWVGSDMRLDVQMKVDPIAEERKAALLEAEEDISDPDEDTLAGQMAVLRGHKTKQSHSPRDGDDDNENGQDDSSSDDD